MKIIYRNETGGVSAVCPTEEWMSAHTIEELVQYVVPDNTPWQIVEDSAIPADRTFRDAWVWE